MFWKTLPSIEVILSGRLMMPPGQMVCPTLAFFAVKELEPIFFKAVNLLKSKLFRAVQFLKEEDPKFLN